jgi:heterodisulfide reductase subunit A
VVATGFQLYDIGREQPEGLKGYGEYGYGEVPGRHRRLQFERLASASGPTGGKILRPSDGKEPKTVVFVHCVGSRDPEKGIEYCSKICCMYNAKHTMLYKHKVHDGRAVVFYMDIRAGRQGLRRVQRGGHRRGRRRVHPRRVSASSATATRSRSGATTRSAGRQVEIDADMVVLATAIRPQPGHRASWPRSSR